MSSDSSSNTSCSTDSSLTVMDADHRAIGAGPNPHVIEEPYAAATAMTLTEAEIARSQRIKRAVEVHPDLDNLTDFEYVQYALTNTGETMEQVLARVRHMQDFRREYRLTDMVEEGVDIYRESTLLFPGFALAVEYLPTSRNFVAINDMKCFYPSQIRTDQQGKIFMASIYYKLQAMSVSFEAIREGISVVTECDGVTFANFDPSFSERFMAEIFTAYPKRHKECMWLNTPTVINLLYGVVKRFCSKEMRDSFVLGCATIPGMEGYRIDTLYTQPTPEISRDYMIHKVEMYLRIRYYNQAWYRLPPTNYAVD